MKDNKTDTSKNTQDSGSAVQRLVMQNCTVVVDVYPTVNLEFDQAYNVWQTYPGQEPPAQAKGTTRYLISFEIPKKIIMVDKQINADSVLQA